jgi:hypothetical protein
MKKAAVFLGLFLMWCAGQVTAGDTEPVSQKTTVILVGTIHGSHYTNPEYSPAVLKQIILSLNPDAILNELPLSQVDSNGRPLYRDPNKNPENWASDTIASQLGIKQIPFDRPDREENFKKTNYFEKEKQAKELFNKWEKEISAKEPNCVDLKMLAIGGLAAQAQTKLTRPEAINSNAFDFTINIKHAVFYEITPQILARYNRYETAASDFTFLAEQWKERNEIMAKNIIKAAKENPGKRLVVITGCEHRYILRDLLEKEQNIELKEYWEPNLRR